MATTKDESDRKYHLATKDESDRKYHLSVFEAIMKTLPREPPKIAISSLPAPSSSEEEDEEVEEEDEEEEEEEEVEVEEEEEEEEVEDEDKDEEGKEYLTLEHTPAPDDYIWPSDLYIHLNRKAVRDTLKMYRRLDAENKVPADLWQTPTSIIKRMKNSGELPEEKLMEYYYTECFPYRTPFQWLRIVRSKDGEFMLEAGPGYYYRYSRWDIVKCQQYVNLADELLEIKFDPLKMNCDNEDKLGIVECIARKKKLDQLLDFDIRTCVEDIMHIRHEENFLPEILGLYEHLAEYKMMVQKLTRNQEFNLTKGLQSKFHHLGESLIKDVINVSFVEGLKPEEVKDLGKKRVQMYESMPKSSFNTILDYMRYKLARASELGVIYRNSEGIYVNNLRIPC